MEVALLALAYLLGGLTFIPLLLSATWLFVILTAPRTQNHVKKLAKSTSVEASSPEEENADLKAKLQTSDRESDVAAGYFAVCREYVAAGLNGKPPERKTPAGETIAAESPSVYQSMYRSIFERNKSQTPTIEAGKPVKRARNVFYVVLRHGHLVLFDNSDQLEVRHVISLSHYNVDIYGGGAPIPEGELYIKRNCIRLHRAAAVDNATANLAPFYLFSDNCSEKEDFYHALLQSQRKLSGSNFELPVPQEFETEHMIKLIRLLHVSEDANHTKWINALTGRLFLALYKTPEVESLVRDRITKKISRVPKPAFITSLTLKDVYMGESAPILNSLRLKEVMIDGSVTLEADVKYSGKFRSVVAAVAKIELGQRFKPREVDLVLAAEVRRLDGHLLIHVKPPPSNRVWVSFETMPKLELNIEPIVSSRQITYGVIIRAIESRIREVLADTLVLPNWDDFPFTKTEANRYRGGIWESSMTSASSEPSMSQEEAADAEQSITQEEDSASETTVTSPISVPRASIARSTSTIGMTEPSSESDNMGSPPKSPTEKLMRSNSFAAPAPASPATVTKIPVMSNKTKRVLNNGERDAASTMKQLSSRSHDGSPSNTPSRSPNSPASLKSPIPRSPTISSLTIDDKSENGLLEGQATESSSAESSYASKTRTEYPADGALSASEDDITTKALNGTVPGKKATLNESLASATVAAKRWGLGMMQLQKESIANASARAKTGNSSIPTTQPIGRGQPLPPPGEPLPGPADSHIWTSNSRSSVKRKPVSQPSSTSPTTHQKSSSISSINSLSSLFSPSSGLDDQQSVSESPTSAEPNHIVSTVLSPSSRIPLKEEDDVKKPEVKIKTS